MADRSPPVPVLHDLKPGATVLGLYALVGGLVSLIGWIANVPVLADWDHDGIAIQPNTTIAAMAAGLGVVTLVLGRRRLATVLGALAAVLGATVLLEWATGINLGIDTLLMFGRTWGRVGVLFPGRMGPPASVSWTLLGTALVLAANARPRSRPRIVALALGVGALSIAFLSVTGYFYGASMLYSLPRLTVIAVQTSSFILAISVALLLTIHEFTPTRWLLEDSAAGVLARRTLPLVILGPLAIGWVRLRGQEFGLYNTSFGTALYSIALIAMLVATVWWNLSTLSRYERGLRRSEQRLADTLDSITDGFVSFDSGWRFTYVNDEAVRLLDRPRAELIGKYVWEVFPESADQVEGHELRRAMKDRISLEFEAFNPTLRRWFANKAYPMADGGLSLYFEDITLRKGNEEALRLSREQLHAELVGLRRLQTLSVQLVNVGEMTALLKEILSAASDITGTTRGNIQFYDPETHRLRIFVHQGLSRRFVEHFANDGCISICSAAASTGKRVIVEDMELAPELRGSPDLDVFRAEGIRACQTTPLTSRDGHLLGMLSSHFTEARRPSDRELRYLDVLARMAADLIERSQSEQALRDSARRKDEFLAILAHELRNPLAPVRNAVHALKLRKLSDPELIWPVAMIERQTGQMMRLIDDLLDVSRITRGIVELRLEHLDFREIADAVIDACRSEVEARGHTLRTFLPDEPIPLKADRHRLIQAFSNLVGNAAKYTPAGGRIEFIADVTGGALEVLVRDNGVGIPPGKLGEIFELFTQLDRSLERQSGLGIGLTLARQLIALHGGSIEARSEGLGRGSTFVVDLPLAAAREATPIAPRAAEPAVRPRRVLVADDNEDAATSLAFLLELAGHDVRVAGDGEAVLRVAAEFRPDIAFLDIGMPKLNGYEAARRIRQEEWGRTMHLVALTGWGQQSDRQRSESVGFDAHIVKPAAPELIRKLVSEVDARPAERA